MKNFITISLILLSIQMFCQNYAKKTKYLLGTFHNKNTTVNGLSFGAFPQLVGTSRFVKTNGIRLEIPGFGFLVPMGIGSQSPLSKIEDVNYTFNKDQYEFTEIINGVNISSGTFSKVNFNGLTIGIFAQYGILSNGVMLAGLWNFIEVSKGVQISGLLNKTISSNGIQISIKNSSLIMKGAQIGLFNKSKKTKGIQIGLWNVNEKRKLPLFNWNFS